ncbi:MAG: hypothetical protein QOD66_3443 [Solirubrobacteraceae bacterium]|jgi:hypothetical protein|nr:hypothetical protein [Solirubrobacteraceae bacterium]
MDGAWLVRMRWRRRGAWLWPAFAVVTILDALIGHALPPSGDTQTLVGAGLVASFLNLLGIVLLGRAFGAILRRRRRDLPRIVARDYGGTAAIVTIAAALLGAGLINRSTVIDHQQAKRDAIVRAQAWIGDHAPAEFRSQMALVDTYAIEPGGIYRVCMPSSGGVARTYCVIVKTRMPFAQSVSFDGYEPNSVFAAGTR